MKKLIISIATLGLLTSCAFTTPIAVSNAKIGTKRGVSKSVSILNFIDLNGNYGIKEAANNGGITKGIATVDQKVNYLFLISTKELIVTGE
jgi:hypothetical protein